MRSASRARQGLAQTVIVAGVFLLPAELSWSQEASSPRANESPATETATSPDAGVPCATPAEGCAASTCSSSPWAKVPPVTPLPRAGWFIIPPTGPGYYSLKDVVTDTYRQQPPKYPYPPTSIIPNSYFDADYRYLDDPNNTQFDWSDCYKRIHLGDNWLLSIGGEERVRFQHEEGGYLRLHGTDDDYTLVRSRVYLDLWFRDRFRVFAEFYDAQVTGEDLVPNATDVNHSDFLNLFGELKLFELDDNPVYVRAGRQELLYGSQRLISPLDWANTRRTFQGVKAYWHSEKLDVDAFWVQPVIVNPTHFDSPDDGQQFMGAWTTYRPAKGQAVDLYYLYLDNTRPNFVGQFGHRAGQRVNTIGSRYAGDYQHFLWDFEGMYQFGHFSNEETSAGAFTAGLGYQFAGLPMNPQFWIFNDWASGDHKGATGPGHGTFNQLFPFGHYYFGFLDLVGRQNIDDLNMQLAFYPTNWTLTTLQYHIFRLDAARDALYNAGGAAIRRDPTGRAGTDVGDEIDFYTNFHLSQHQDVLIGYSKLFSGAFIRRTGPPLSPDFFYAQYCFKW
jgi:Alginate export